jgi:hypothetical protein
MESNTDESRKNPESEKLDRKADPKVPPASETWVEGQPTSDADYEEPPAENS